MREAWTGDTDEGVTDLVQLPGLHELSQEEGRTWKHLDGAEGGQGARRRPWRSCDSEACR